jgi:hypothetical protein
MLVCEIHGTTKVLFSSCAKVFRNVSDKMRGSHILQSHTGAILTVTRSHKRPTYKESQANPKKYARAMGKNMLSSDGNKNAGSKTGQKHKNGRALCLVKYGENIQCSQDECIQDRVTIFRRPIFLS